MNRIIMIAERNRCANVIEHSVCESYGGHSSCIRCGNGRVVDVERPKVEDEAAQQDRSEAVLVREYRVSTSTRDK